MTLAITAGLRYRFARPTDILLQLEAALIPEQKIEESWIALPGNEHFARVPSQDGIGERIWLLVENEVTVEYRAKVTVQRDLPNLAELAALPPHKLPGETVPYLMDSLYCPAGKFQTLVDDLFGDVAGGAKIAAMRDWIEHNLRYQVGASTASTTALDTFVERRGVCRDYAHLMVSFARAAAIPARVASVYALGVTPQDFHLVAEVFLSGAWHLVDATGMAQPAHMAKIGIGRDAADVSFLTSFGIAELVEQSVDVTEV